MGSIDYKKLYSLQDRVLDKVFSVEDEFYLTGGTALSRFYKAKRYSDDLDFFTNSSTRFNFAIKNIGSVYIKGRQIIFLLETTPNSSSGVIDLRVSSRRIQPK